METGDELDRDAIMADIAALDTLPTGERLALLRHLATVVLPAVLDATNWPARTVVDRDTSTEPARVLVRCGLCGAERWQHDEGYWCA